MELPRLSAYPQNDFFAILARCTDTSGFIQIESIRIKGEALAGGAEFKQMNMNAPQSDPLNSGD